MSKKTLHTLTLLSFYTVFSQEETIRANDTFIQLENLPINNGTSYENKYWNTTTKETQFLLNEYTPSIISYDGKLYYDILLKLDLLLNQVLYKPSFITLTEICLINEHIDFIIINKTKFKKITLSGSVIYVEETKIDNISLYRKKGKALQEDLTEQRIKYSFYHNKEEFYLLKDDKNYLIKNKRSLFEIFPEKKKEIQKFYSENSALEKNNLNNFYTKLIKDVITYK